ncbi:MAG: beta-class carbonic anhydrase [Actinomycetota bacterium]
MGVTDELVGNNAAFAQSFQAASLGPEPVKKVTVVSCMDARIDVHAVLGLRPGDAHVIRNAGGVVTDDVVRSLVLSQRLLGTEEIVVMQHTECGLQELPEDEVRVEIARDTGIEPDFPLLGFDDLEGSVRRSIGRLSSDPLLPHRSSVRGFVYDVRSGRVTEVA